MKKILLVMLIVLWPFSVKAIGASSYIVMDQDSKRVLEGSNINKESFVYYVHSFMATEMIDENLIAYSKYGDINIPGIVNKGNVYGMQFHPEKSGEVGLKILKNFGVLSK